MKKNNFTTDDDINLSDLIRALSKEKILILFMSIIFGLLGYLYASFQPQFLKTEIKLTNPPIQLFEPYNYIIEKSKTPYICYNPNNPNNPPPTTLLAALLHNLFLILNQTFYL